jgi:hypothetical protein
MLHPEESARVQSGGGEMEGEDKLRATSLWENWPCLHLGHPDAQACQQGLGKLQKAGGPALQVLLRSLTFGQLMFLLSTMGHVPLCPASTQFSTVP